MGTYTNLLQAKKKRSPKPKKSGDEIALKTDSPPLSKEIERKSARTKKRSEQRSEQRTVDLPIKRRTKRYSFEFYDDQITQLKKIKIETEMRGENISLSEIVRTAIDEYFERKEV